MKKKIISFSLIICIFVSLVSCGQIEKTVTTGKLSVEHETDYGGVYFHITEKDFLSLGFEYGDSVKIELSNGKTYDNVPFYSGFFCKTDELLLLAYPSYPYIKLCINCGEDLYTKDGYTEDCTATVSLKEKARYKKIQQIFEVEYSNDRSKYASDEIFANFREITTGNICKKMFYRSASPCDNKNNRAEYVDSFCKKAGIKYMINLSDKEEKLKSLYDDKSVSCYCFRELYDKSKISIATLKANFKSEDYRNTIASSMRDIMANEGPFLIHCIEGKDRTGFYCLLIESLAGATIEEIAADYMKTYDNYFGITKEKDEEKYNAIVELRLYDYMYYLCGTNEKSEITPEALEKGVEKYLTDGGLSKNEIISLKETLTSGNIAVEG